MQQETAYSAATTSPLWGRSIAWLLFLGPFFFLSYGFSNHLAAEREPLEVGATQAALGPGPIQNTRDGAMHVHGLEIRPDRCAVRHLAAHTATRPQCRCRRVRIGLR